MQLSTRNPRFLRGIIGRLWIVAGFCSFAAAQQTDTVTSPQEPVVKLALFDIDATPPVGSIMAYNPVRRVDEITLRCRGMVILGSGRPIVLCAVDWIGIGNEGHDVFRETIAKAAGTDPRRVAVHSLHQHDAPACDFSAERLLMETGHRELGRYGGAFARDVLKRLSGAIEEAIRKPQRVTHYGTGSGEVVDVASNRRILGPDGKVKVTRFTATTDPEVRSEPVGTIDPMVDTISFWNGEEPLAILSYYACHPQSYYRVGIPSPDFPGIARFIRGQDLNETLHVHFNGAGGNIGAGKYNDGSRENRLALAIRLAEGMKQAYRNTQKITLSPADIDWTFEPVSIPASSYLNEDKLREELKRYTPETYFGAADELAFFERVLSGRKIELGCLKVGNARILHMPGELFVEYQLAAKSMRPDLKVMMAAYGDYGPGYIGTAIAYSQGGYETAPGSSMTSPDVEAVLINGMKKLLEVAP